MRRILRSSLATLALMNGSALAQTAPAPAPPAPAATSPAAPAASTPASTAAPAPQPTPSPETVIAKVGPDTIHYADLQEAMSTLPPQLRQMPPAMIYPMLLDQLVDRDVITQQAKKDKLQDDPKVQQAIQRATDMALQNALLTREIQPMLTQQAIEARYQKEYASKQGDEEVRASHILVPTEKQAKDIIAQLQKGANFADLAKKTSTDPSAKENSGELGWFKKADMLPEFSDAAFALQPGEITKTPVHTRFGWHVIKLEQRRTAPPPSLDQVRDQIRQQIIQEGVAKVLTAAKTGLKIEEFNPDGTPITPPPGTPPGTPASGAATPGK